MRDTKRLISRQRNVQIIKSYQDICIATNIAKYYCKSTSTNTFTNNQIVSVFLTINCCIYAQIFTHTNAIFTRKESFILPQWGLEKIVKKLQKFFEDYLDTKQYEAYYDEETVIEVHKKINTNPQICRQWFQDLVQKQSVETQLEVIVHQLHKTIPVDLSFDEPTIKDIMTKCDRGYEQIKHAFANIKKPNPQSEIIILGVGMKVIEQYNYALINDLNSNGYSIQYLSYQQFLEALLQLVIDQKKEIPKKMDSDKASKKLGPIEESTIKIPPDQPPINPNPTFFVPFDFDTIFYFIAGLMAVGLLVFALLI